MKKCQQLRWVYVVLICMLLSTGWTHAQNTGKDKERMKWWTEARFGMFIHWGIYAQYAGVYKGHEQADKNAEWIMNRCKIPVSEYQDMAKRFNPVNYDPDEWVRMAKEAGMKYLIITTKHHDGFALFKSAASKWNVVDATPYGKDLLKPLAAACRKYGIKLGFYYSHAQDWINPGGKAWRREMRQGWPNPDSARIDAYTLAHKGHWDPAQETRTFDEYIDGVAVPQVKELMTNYGDIAVLWWDTPTDMTDEAALKLQAQLKLQPGIITNDRLKRPNFPGDTKTAEQNIPDRGKLDGKYWETCMTMNGTWGYRTADNEWKSTETLIRNLIDIASKGGNYLLNVGPKPDGTFPEPSIARLKEIGEWMKVNSEAIYATEASPLAPVAWGRCTMKETGDNTILYLSVFNWPADGRLTIPGIKNEISSVKLLATDQQLKADNSKGNVSIDLPTNAPDKIASVIKIELKGKIEKAHHAILKIKEAPHPLY